MRYEKLTLGLLLCIFWLTANLHASELDSQVLQTQYLKPVVGAKESALGAQIVAIERDNNSIRIELSLPKDESEAELIMEEMIVLGQPSSITNLPEGFVEIQQVKKFEWLNNIDRGEYGLVLYLPKSESFALKINYRNLSQEHESGFAPHSLKGIDKGR